MFVANLPQQPQWNTRIWNMAMHKSLIDKPQQTDPGLFVRFVLGAGPRVKVALRHTYVYCACVDWYGTRTTCAISLVPDPSPKSGKRVWCSCHMGRGRTA